ncbi:MAG: peptidoglycan DD-metalloendopeptidase family protein [Patescibacteria group bacterium]
MRIEKDPNLNGGKRLAYEQLAIFGLHDSRAGLVDFLNDFWLFVKSVVIFMGRKLLFLASLPKQIFFALIHVITYIKSFIVHKLVWGRGRLSGPATRLGVTLLVVFVFLAGSSSWARSEVAFGPLGQEEDILMETAFASPVSFESAPSGDPIKYTVSSGDTLSSIGEKFKVSVSSIVYANGLDDMDYVSPGQELTIPPVSGVLHTVKKGDTVDSLASKYDVSPQSIVDFNYLFAPFTLSPGETLVVPGGTVPTPDPDPEPSPSTQYAAGGRYDGTVSDLGTGQFAWPTNYRSISQYYSRWHPAIDVPKFSPIYAIDGGTVVDVRYSGWNYGYGKMIRIDHGNGYRSLYAHFSSMAVRPGQTVSRGQVLGNMGNTGRSYGTHLHIEITYQGRYVNPLSVL